MVQISFREVMESFRIFSPLAKSAIFLTAGVSIFGFADNLTLMISDQVSVGQFHFSRSFIACLIVVLASFLTGERLLPVKWKAVSIRTLFNTISMLLYFGVIPLMPIAEAGAGLFTSPIFVLFFSFILFGEKISNRQIFSFLLGLVGVALIFGSKFSNFSIYHFFPILAGACYAIGAIITNRHCSEESPMALLFFFLVSIGVTGFLVTGWFTIYPVSEVNLEDAPFLFKSWQAMDNFYWLIVGFVGVSGTIAIYLMIKAYQICKPTYSAIFEYIYLLSAGFFGWLLWGTVPTFWGLIGIMVIILAGTNIILSKAHSQSDK